ncbi:TrkH family potassium uptake protein [bacterium]|nr:TrkH family potassium uptake protein [bacterium]
MKSGYLSRIQKSLYSFISFCAAVGVIETIIFRGFTIYEPELIRLIIHGVYSVLIVLYLIWVALRVIESGWQLRAMIPDLALSVLLISAAFPITVSGSIISIRIVLALAVVFLRKFEMSAFATRIRLNPASVLLLSFFLVIVIGVLLLMLPAATVDKKGTGFIDAVFTSTSATCVTGLIVQDTGSYFSSFGQVVILILIQVGGLGIMTLSTLFAMILGRRLGLKQEEHMRGILDLSGPAQMYKLIVQIIRITVFFELMGAFFLFLKWYPVMGSHHALKHAVFHSISAFCNAGFSLNSTSLVGYVSDISVNCVVVMLILFGGFGFMVIDDLIKNIRNYNPLSLKWSRLNTHTKIVLTTSAVLLVVGTLSVFFFEFDNAMLDLSTGNKLLAAFFQSTTLRTAGFNTIDIGTLRDVTLFISIMLMFIGASPSSTGGGIKTTTFAVLILTVRAMLTSRDKVEIFSRTIPQQTVYKSIAIMLFSSTFVIGVTVLLLATQQGEFIDVLFEAVSAIGTVGLSTGVTGHLDTVGKLLITLLMYVGRVGPLTMALALGEVKKVNIEYPTTRVAVG